MSSSCSGRSGGGGEGWSWVADPAACDVDLLNRVVLNVLDNAASYTDQGGQVRITISQDQSHFTITVRNSGSAISDRQAEQVFQRFWRGDAARNETAMHSGLGLSIVKRIVEILNGDAKVSSELDGEFEIELSFPSNDDCHQHNRF